MERSLADFAASGHWDGPAPTLRVAIIGGGFSGAVTAIHLAGLLPAPARIDVIEPRAMLGGGVAYSATDPAHRINVPATRMVVFGDDPTQFDRWMRAHGALQDDPAALWQDGSAFPQRAVFGRYIAQLAANAAHARPGVTLRHVKDRVAAIAAGTGVYRLTLAGGGMLAADLVILAVSHPPPSVPAALRAAQAQGAPVIADPWRPGALDAIPPEAGVVIVGTGLTMADAAATLHRRGHRGPILAVSRRGLLSRGHAFGDIAKRDGFETAPPCRTALGLTRAIRAQIATAQAEGAPWQAVFDDVRANAPRLWAALDNAERRRIVRHIRPFWDVHRFRVAPQPEAAIATMRARGQFTSAAASLRRAAWDGAVLSLTLHPRWAPSGAERVVQAGAVIVTTGPAHGSILASNPALASLAAAGLVQPDQIGLGLEVDAGNRAVGRDGTARPDLFVVGPLARGRVGELMGLPQVSTHAQDVAEQAAAWLRRRRHAGNGDVANDASPAEGAAAFPP
jgi:uncharacterized NAD(P)/FAD-binding protein YdhS